MIREFDYENEDYDSACSCLIDVCVKMFEDFQLGEKTEVLMDKLKVELYE